MSIAHEVANMSYSQRLKVGAIVVKDNRIISMGYNGTPEGWDNTCEDRVYMDPGAGGWLSPDEIALQWPFIERVGEFDQESRRYKLVTRPEVIHAEMNALMKLAGSTESGRGASLFTTHSPCLAHGCAIGIYTTGIKEVFYHHEYRDTSGVDFLRKCNIEVVKL